MNKLLFLILLLFSSLSFAGRNSGLAVVLIDMQYAFYERSGVSGTPELENLIKNQQKLLRWANKNSIPVLIFEVGYIGPTDTRLTSMLEGHEHTYVTKYTDSGFVNRSAQEARRFLDDFDVDTLIVAGINGPWCVRSTMIDAIFSQKYNVITSDDLVADLNHNPPTYPFSNFRVDGHKFLQYKTVEQIIQ